MPTEKKLILIGPPGVGKTSLRMTFFDGLLSKDLVGSPLEPTRRKDYREYTWLNLTVRCVDCPGQMLDRWHGQDEDATFLETDAIIYMVEADPSQRDPITTEYRRILISHAKYCPQAAIYVLIHKADLVPDDRKAEVLQTISTYITSEGLGPLTDKYGGIINAPPHPQAEFFLTSLIDGSAFDAMRKILNKYSRRGEAYQKVCDQLALSCGITKGDILLIEQKTGFVVAEKTIGFPEASLVSSIQKGLLELFKAARDKVAKEINQGTVDGHILLCRDLQYMIAPIEDALLLGVLVPRTVQLGLLYFLVDKACDLIQRLARIYGNAGTLETLAASMEKQ
jgi:Ras-related GTP-binding protein A/B